MRTIRVEIEVPEIMDVATCCKCDFYNNDKAICILFAERIGEDENTCPACKKATITEVKE